MLQTDHIFILNIRTAKKRKKEKTKTVGIDYVKMTKNSSKKPHLTNVAFYCENFCFLYALLPSYPFTIPTL